MEKLQMTQPQNNKRDFAKKKGHGVANKPKLQIVAAEDGVNHINIFSRGKTELGVFASNFPRYPFKHPQYGMFDSMEGFWHWASTGKQHDVFRKLSGLEAKNMAKQFIRVENPDFHEEIKFAIECKFNAYPLFKMKLTMNKLPLLHYFVFKGKDNGSDIVVDQPKFMWQVKHIEALAEKWRKG
jgi:hypothetical protein